MDVKQWQPVWGLKPVRFLNNVNGYEKSYGLYNRIIADTSFTT